MGQVKKADEEIGNAQEQEKPVALDAPGIPGDDKDGEGNDDTEQFREGVKEEKIVQGAEMRGLPGPGRGREYFLPIAASYGP
jgi:hypothetical protein